MIYLLICLICIFNAYKIAYLVMLLPIKLYLKRNGVKTFNENHTQRQSTNKKTIILPRGLLSSYVRLFIYQTGMIPSHTIRKFVYTEILGVNIGHNVLIYYGAEIRSPKNLKIGNGTIIGDRATLDARNGIVIGSNVNFSSNVSIWTEQHDHRDPYFRCTQPKKAVEIGDRAWIGSNVEILPNVIIGEGAVCAAGCVVTKDVPPYAIVAGIPAKVIGTRSKELKYELNETAHFL